MSGKKKTPLKIITEVYITYRKTFGATCRMTSSPENPD
jgi:hypothetical protein